MISLRTIGILPMEVRPRNKALCIVQQHTRGLELRLSCWRCTDWLYILVLPFPAVLNLGKLLTLNEPQFPHLKMWITVIYHIKLIYGLNKLL